MSASDAPLNLLLGAARRAERGLARDLGELENLQGAPESAKKYARAGRRKALGILRESLLEASPAYGWIDDSGAEKGKDPLRYWIVEPVSGMANFAHGSPGFALVAGFLQKGEMEAVVVLDPATGEMFTGRRGSGAKRENLRLRVASRSRLLDCLVAVSMPEDQEEASIRQLVIRDMERTTALGANLRGTGSPALDLAWVASGRLDAAWLRPGRTPAAIATALLVHEAGGKTHIPDRREPRSEGTLAASPRVFDTLASELLVKPSAE